MKFPFLLLAAVALFLLPSCTVSVDPVTGKPVVGVDGVALGDFINDRVNERLAEVDQNSGK